MTTPTIPTIDDLDRSIVCLSKKINTATYELLVLVRQFDERAGWLKWGFEHCADWLHWRCDLSMNAAREKVRVAHALKALPATSRAFENGELSYSKVRALTRVADRDNEADLLAFSSLNTAAQVEERCRELRFGTEESTADANRAFANRSLVLRRNAERGTLMVTAELPIEVGELLDKALDRAREDRNSVELNDSWAARQADALVELARSYLSGGSEESSTSSDQYLVNLHVDQSALAAGSGRAGIPVETARRISCDANKVLIVDDKNGKPLSVGRKTRTVPSAIKRALKARDKGCRFPGCHNKRFVDAHHVQHWASGGETSLANLVLLCSRHHRLVHEGGYRIEKDFRDRWMFRRQNGIAVPSCGYRPSDRHDEDLETGINDLERPPAGGLRRLSVRAP